MIAADLLREREPGCDDDLDEEEQGELVPIWFLLEHHRLAETVRRLSGEAQLAAEITNAIDDHMRAALDEVLNGVRSNLGEHRDLWLLLANNIAVKLPHRRRAA